MNGISYLEEAIERAILNINTAYLGEVVGLNGNFAQIQPLTVHKPKGGNATKQSITSAYIPENIKSKQETITYLTSINSSATKTVLVPAALSVGDIVYVGVCDRDITNALKGKISEATPRHHDINDGVILKVLR